MVFSGELVYLKCYFELIKVNLVNSKLLQAEHIPILGGVLIWIYL